MPKNNLTSEKSSVEKLVKEVEALKKAPRPKADQPLAEKISESPGIAPDSGAEEASGVPKKRIPDLSKLSLASKASTAFASGSNKMSWIAGGIVIAMMMGILVGYFFMKPLWAPPVEEPSSGPTPAELSQPKTVTMHGVIRPLEASIYMQGTHQLIGEDGETVAVLEPSAKIQDLAFLEGSEVDVEGPASKTVEGDMMVIEVEKVRF